MTNFVSLIKNLHQTLKILLDIWLFYTIKFDVLLVYAFTQTPLLLIYIVAVIFGFFANMRYGVFTFSCFLFWSYIFSTSMLIFFVCNVKGRGNWVEKLVGIHFLKRFAPRNGLYGMLIAVLLVLIFTIIDLASLKYIISSKSKECEESFLVMVNSVETGQIHKAIEASDIRKKILASTDQGIISELTGHPFFVKIHNLFCETK